MTVSITRLESCQAPELVSSDACLRPAAGLVKLYYKYSAVGQLMWRNVSLRACPAAAPRKPVRVAAACQTFTGLTQDLQADPEV
jgi:hypothetical protein